MSSTLAAKIRALQAEAKANFNTNNIYFLDAPTMEHWGFKVKVLGSSTQQQESLMRLKQSTFYLEISQSCQAIDLALSKIKVLIDAVINQDIDLKVKLCSYDLIVNDQVSANRMRLLEIDSFLAQQSKLKNSIYFLNSLKGVLQLYPLAYFLQEQNFKSADLNLNLNILDCFTPEQKEQIQHMAVLLDSKHEPCKWLLNVATLSKALCSQEDLGIIYACSLLGLDNLLQAFNSLKRMESDLTIDQMIDKLSALYNNDTHATIVRLQDFVTGSSYASFKLKKADPLDGYDFINHIANKNPKELVLNVDLKAVAKKGLTLTNVAPTKAKKGLELTNVAVSASTKPASLESKPVAQASVAPAPQADEAAKADNAPALTKAKKGLELTNVAASVSTKPASLESKPVAQDSVAPAPQADEAAKADNAPALTKAKKGLELTNVAASVSTKPASLESKPVAHDSVAPAPQADEAAKSDNAPAKAKKGLELTNVAASASTKPASLESKPVTQDSVAPAPQADEAAKADNAPAKAKKGLELTNVAASASTKPASVAPTKEERAPVVKESTKVEAMSDSENAIKSDESKRNKDELEDVYVELDDRAFNVVKNYYERTDMHEVQPTNFLHKAKQHFESIIENLEAFCEEKEHPTITKDPKHKVFRTTKTKEETKAKPLAPLPDATSIEDYNIIDVAALEEQENHSESDEGTVTVKTSAKSDAVLSQDKVNSQAASSDTDSAGLKIVWQLFSGEEIVETDRQRPVSHEIVSANLGTNSTVSKDQAKDNIKDSALASVGIEMTQVAPKANSDASSDYVSVQSGSSLRLENADQEIKGSGATLSNVLEVAPVALSLTNTQDQAQNTLVLQAASDTKNLELGALPNSGAHESSLGGISALTDGLNLVAARIETNTFQGAEYVLSNQKQTLPAINEVLTQDNTDALKAKSISADSEDKELEHSKPSSKGSSLLAKIKEKDKKTTKKKRDLEAEKAKAQGVWEMAISKTKDESSDSSTAKATKEQPSEATTLELQDLNAKPAVASSSTDVAADIQEPEQDTQGLTDLENQGLDKSNALQESTASEDKSAAHKLDRVRDLAQAVNHGIAKKKQAQAKALACDSITCDSITSEAQLTEAEKSKALLQQKPTDEQLAAYKEACSMVGVHKSTSCHNISASDHLAQDVIKNPYSNNSSSTSLANLLTKEDKAPKASAVTNETMHVGTFDPLTATYIATESSSSCEQVAAPKEDKTPEASVSSSAVTNETMHVGAFDPLSATYIATESSSSCEQVAAPNALRTQKQEQSEAEKTKLADTATIEAQGEGETESFDDDFMQDFLASQSPDFFGDNFSNNENYNYPDNAARENDWDQLLECDDALIKLKYTVLYAQSMLLTQSQYDSLLEGNPFTAPKLRAWQNVANSTLNQSLGTIKTLEGYKETMIDLLSNHNNDMNVLNQHLSKFKYYRRTLGTTWEVQANNVKGPYGKAERVSFESLANTNKVHFVLACLLLCAGNISKLANECLLERAYKNCNLESPI